MSQRAPISFRLPMHLECLTRLSFSGKDELAFALCDVTKGINIPSDSGDFLAFVMFFSNNSKTVSQRSTIEDDTVVLSAV